MERRPSRRKRVLKSGKIILGKKHIIPCGVRNVSATGACLEVRGTFGIPAEFSFSMYAHPPRACKMIWRDDSRIGIVFI
jgi:hypothetical protein